jgi:hypothetical protein
MEGRMKYFDKDPVNTRSFYIAPGQGRVKALPIGTTVIFQPDHFNATHHPFTFGSKKEFAFTLLIREMRSEGYFIV